MVILNTDNKWAWRKETFTISNESISVQRMEYFMGDKGLSKFAGRKQIVVAYKRLKHYEQGK